MKLVKNMTRSISVASMLFFSVNASAATVLTYGEPGPNRGARAAVTQWFADEVEKRSAGDLKIDIQWGGALFKAKAARQSIASGVSDMGTIIQAYFPKELVSYSIGDLPFDNQDPWVGLKALSAHMDDASIKKHLEKQNLVFIAPYTVSKVVLVCKGDAVRTIDDVKGKDVRGISAYGKVFTDLGANHVNMSFYKTYQAMDSGLIDCTQSYLSASAAVKHQEIADSVTKLNWGVVSALGMYINKGAYDSLSVSQQKVLADVAADFVDYHGQSSLNGDIKGEQILKEGGLEVVDLPAEDSRKLSVAGQLYIQEWAKKASGVGLQGEHMVKRYQEYLDKYSRERDEKGYPWVR